MTIEETLKQYQLREIDTAKNILDAAKDKVAREKEELEFQERDMKERKRRLAIQKARVEAERKKLKKAEENMKKVEGRLEVIDVDKPDVKKGSDSMSPVVARAISDEDSDESPVVPLETDTDAGLSKNNSSDANVEATNNANDSDSSNCNSRFFLSCDDKSRSTFPFQNIVVEWCGEDEFDGTYMPGYVIIRPFGIEYIYCKRGANPEGVELRQKSDLSGLWHWELVRDESVIYYSWRDKRFKNDLPKQCDFDVGFFYDVISDGPRLTGQRNFQPNSVSRK